MKKMILISVSVLALAVVLWVVFRQHKITAEFESALPGKSEGDVVRELGKPWKTSKCGEIFGGNSSAACAREDLYSSPLAPANPEYWGFMFDQNGRLVDKYHYVSP